MIHGFNIVLVVEKNIIKKCAVQVGLLLSADDDISQQLRRYIQVGLLLPPSGQITVSAWTKEGLGGVWESFVQFFQQLDVSS